MLFDSTTPLQNMHNYLQIVRRIMSRPASSYYRSLASLLGIPPSNHDDGPLSHELGDNGLLNPET